LSLRLDRAFTEGIQRDFQLGNGGAVSPPSEKVWLLLSGVITHKTGTDTVVWAEVHKPYAQHAIFERVVPSATANGTFPLFSVKSEDKNPQWTPVIIDENGRIRAAGDAAILVNFTVLEWSLHEVS